MYKTYYYLGIMFQHDLENVYMAKESNFVDTNKNSEIIKVFNYTISYQFYEL